MSGAKGSQQAVSYQCRVGLARFPRGSGRLESTSRPRGWCRFPPGAVAVSQSSGDTTSTGTITATSRDAPDDSAATHQQKPACSSGHCPEGGQLGQGPSHTPCTNSCWNTSRAAGRQPTHSLLQAYTQMGGYTPPGTMGRSTQGAAVRSAAAPSDLQPVEREQGAQPG